MASSDKRLLKSLRGRGLRKRAAREVVRATNGESKPKAARHVVADLGSVVFEVNDRLRHGPEKRSAAARKAAKTRQGKAAARSQAAKRGARTKARHR